MAGLYPLSRMQQFSSNGRPLSGARLFLYDGGTSTPRIGYKDSSLTSAQNNMQAQGEAGGARNALNAGMSLASLAAGGMGGSFGFGGGLSGLQGALGMSQAGPTYASTTGSQGMMGGVPFQIMR